MLGALGLLAAYLVSLLATLLIGFWAGMIFSERSSAKKEQDPKS